ncbi:MAG: hypothetical protein RL567_1279 [Bacteroidota bacterium]|jgi:uncharacterized protein YjlB
MSQETYYFADDGLIPNHKFPVIVYQKVVDLADCSDWLENRFKENNWLNNWRDIVLPYDHFHSNTHEVLGLGWGRVSLNIGGSQGRIVHLNAGDVVIIPAGVGHYAVSKHTDYQFVGGYPNGLAWDLKTGLEQGERAQIVSSISAVEMPEKDPVFGQLGLLFDKWTS